MPAPTLGQRTAPQQQNGGAKAPVAVIPFTRASRRKSRLAAQVGPVVLNASQQALQPMQLPAAGFLRYIDLTITGTTAANAANVAFQNDGPFNLLQQISLLSANGDALISPIDGFSLYLLNKYAALGRDRYDPVADPNYSVTTGVGAGTGGSFKFKLRIPIEVDSRDGFGALQNMAANQSFLLQVSLNNTAGLYTTAPTTAPSIQINAVMEYWAAPAGTNATGDVQAVTPPGIGSVSLIQTQQPPITANSQQNIQQLNVGNTIRAVIYVLRTGAGVRSEADWPSVTNFYVNNDPWYYKTKENWRSQMGTNYQLAAPTATPTAGAMDNGVFVLNDFINQGSAGNERTSSGGNRNEWLVTGSATAFNIEAVNWGAAASQLLILQNTIRPSSPAAVYQPQFN